MTVTDLHVDAFDAEMCRIVEDVLVTMTQYSVYRADAPYSPDAGHTTCAVYFAGSWSGAVLLECPFSMASEFTSRLMGIPRPAGFNDDVSDALGELANMVGGNLKSVLPKGVSLSMPSVVEGQSYSVRVCGTNRNRRMAFTGPDGPFWVTLVETA